MTEHSSKLVRGRYEILEVAGEGGQGQVVRALDRQLSRQVALKIRSLKGASREEMLAEARVLMSLTPHPALPLVRDDFFEGDNYYFVMDWIDGMSLDKLIRLRGDPGLPRPVLLDYLRQVAEALDHLHAHHPPIIHQDVKPANIILTPEGKIMLVDFGISSRRGHVDARVAGSRGFVAPEVVQGRPPTPAADVYSLAATAVALLTGHGPGEGPSALDLPPGVRNIVEALRPALVTDPSMRTASAADLVRIMEGRLGPRAPESPGEAQPATIGDRLVAPLVDLVIAAVVALLVPWSWKRGDEYVSLLASGSKEFVGGGFALTVLALWSLQEIGFIAWRGQTFGRMMARIRVTSIAGGAPSAATALTRFLLKLVPVALLLVVATPVIIMWLDARAGYRDIRSASALAGPHPARWPVTVLLLPLSAAVLWAYSSPLFDVQRRALHDKIARTVVVKAR